MRFITSKNIVCHNREGVLTSGLPVEDFLFSTGGGFLFDAVAGYAIKKMMNFYSFYNKPRLSSLRINLLENNIVNLHNFQKNKKGSRSVRRLGHIARSISGRILLLP